MAIEELLQTLKNNEQQQIDAIWQEVKDEAESLRQQVAEEIAAVTKKHAEQLEAACQKSMRTIFSEADVKIREKKLFAYHALGQALQKAAVSELPTLRQQGYAEIFAELVRELPARQWETITVNPADVALAASFFSADSIRPDPAIIGGLVATAAEGRIIVDNTFGKRLEKKWHHILPAILTKIEKRHEESGSAENTG